MRTTETRAQIEVKLGILFELVDAAAGFHDINRRSDKIVHAAVELSDKRRSYQIACTLRENPA